MRYITRSEDHYYTYAGRKYPGVTGILKVIDKSGPLMSWAARQTAEAAIGLLDTSKSSIQLGSDGISIFYRRPMDTLLESVGPEGVVKAITSRSTWKRDEAASLGSEVHRLADEMVRGLSPDIPERAAKHVAGYAEWWPASGWTLRSSESMVIHPTHGYGGTIDLLARDRDGRTVLADIKTGKAVYQEAVLQLTAYGAAEFIETDAGIFNMPKIDRYVILHVTAEGVREVEVAVGTLEELAWGACIDLATWRDTMKGKSL